MRKYCGNHDSDHTMNTLFPAVHNTCVTDMTSLTSLKVMAVVAVSRSIATATECSDLAGWADCVEDTGAGAGRCGLNRYTDECQQCSTQGTAAKCAAHVNCHWSGSQCSATVCDASTSDACENNEDCLWLVEIESCVSLSKISASGGIGGVFNMKGCEGASLRDCMSDGSCIWDYTAGKCTWQPVCTRRSSQFAEATADNEERRLMCGNDCYPVVDTGECTHGQRFCLSEAVRSGTERSCTPDACDWVRSANPQGGVCLPKTHNTEVCFTAGNNATRCAELRQCAIATQMGVCLPVNYHMQPNWEEWTAKGIYCSVFDWTNGCIEGGHRGNCEGLNNAFARATPPLNWTGGPPGTGWGHAEPLDRGLSLLYFITRNLTSTLSPYSSVCREGYKLNPFVTPRCEEQTDGTFVAVMTGQICIEDTHPMAVCDVWSHCLTRQHCLALLTGDACDAVPGCQTKVHNGEQVCLMADPTPVPPTPSPPTLSPPTPAPPTPVPVPINPNAPLTASPAVSSLFAEICDNLGKLQNRTTVNCFADGGCPGGGTCATVPQDVLSAFETSLDSFGLEALEGHGCCSSAGLVRASVLGIFFACMVAVLA